MPSLNLDLNYFDHPKTLRLVALLGIGSDVLPVKLWAYCGRYHAEHGRLKGLSALEIESIVRWWGRPGKMIEVFLKLGFLHEEPDGFRVHDWREHEGHLAMYHERARKAAKARWKGLKAVP